MVVALLLTTKVASLPYHTLSLHTPSLDLHPSIEDDNHPHLPSPQAPFDPMKSVMEELNIPSGASTPTDSSPTQIQETATAIVNHLKKHGKVIK